MNVIISRRILLSWLCLCFFERFYLVAHLARSSYSCPVGASGCDSHYALAVPEPLSSELFLVSQLARLSSSCPVFVSLEIQ